MASPGQHPSLTKHRYSSRSNSLSSSSVVTIKLAPSKTAPYSRRRSSIAADPTPTTAEPTEIREGIVNLNRWSHSTTSSRSSVGHAAGKGAPVMSSPSRHSPVRQRSSPTTGPYRSRRYQDGQTPLTALPPIVTPPSLMQTNNSESPSTAQSNTPSSTGLRTPSTHSSYAMDYFSENLTLKKKRPITLRNQTAPSLPISQDQLRDPSLADSRRQGSPSRFAPVAETRSRYPQGDAPKPREQRTAHEPRQLGNRSKSRDSRSTRARHSIAHNPRYDSSTPLERDHERVQFGGREKREKDKKNMLSKALQKANSAVLLDNAQNFEGALDDYEDACHLLQQVMERSSGLEDKRKLEAIRITYRNRIEELRQLYSHQPPGSIERALPARPMSEGPLNLEAQQMSTNSRIEEPEPEPTVLETANVTRIIDAPVQKPDADPSQRDSVLTSAIKEIEGTASSNSALLGPLWERERSTSPAASIKKRGSSQRSPMDSTCMPPPLSPRRPPSRESIAPAPSPSFDDQDVSTPTQSSAQAQNKHRSDSTGTVSWLDTIDESVSSRTSSIHSVGERGVRRKHIRAPSDDTGAEFDAAFDAAVEAAYDDGFEPDAAAIDPVESVCVASGAEQTIPLDMQDEELDPWRNTDEDEEEERLLDEITKDYTHSFFDFDSKSKSALPRQSDSSGYSRKTWESSVASDRTTAGTSLSTVAEDVLSSMQSSDAMVAEPMPSVAMGAPLHPPPNTSLPRPPGPASTQIAGVRSRRLSGQNAKQLKIETSRSPIGRRTSISQRQSVVIGGEAQIAVQESQARQAKRASLKRTETTSTTASQPAVTLPLSNGTLGTSDATATNAAMLTMTVTHDEVGRVPESPSERRPARPPRFRRTKSSLSLRETRSPDDSGSSLITPMSTTFSVFPSRRGRDQDYLATPRAHIMPTPTFPPSSADPVGVDSFYLFDTSLQSPVTTPIPTPHSPSGSSPGCLEPCPQSHYLRPFWLTRVLLSTLTNPRGGFLTKRLFVPRAAWSTRGVKLKAVDEKIAQCDLLTAAL
ncbi:hypothetical protein LTR66_012656, partial [Elasticomyces elasticus]